MRDSSTAQAQRELAKRSVLARCIFMIIGWCISLHTHARIASYAHSPCRRCESSVVSRLRHTSPLATLACTCTSLGGGLRRGSACLLSQQIEIEQQPRSRVVSSPTWSVRESTSAPITSRALSRAPRVHGTGSFAPASRAKSLPPL